MIKWIALASLVTCCTFGSVLDLLKMNRLGDSRRAVKRLDIPFLSVTEGGLTNRIAPFFSIAAPRNVKNDITFTFWARCYKPNLAPFVAGYAPGLHVNYTPQTTREPTGDLANGAFGYPTETNFAGAISIPFTFSQPTNVPTMVFTRGVYNARGWASNSVTLTAGGKDITLPAGEFSQNFEPGEADGLIISGGGKISIAIARPRVHEFFGGFQVPVSGDSSSVPPGFSITNEIVFVSFKVCLDGTNHTSKTTIWRKDWESFVEVSATNPLPADASVRSLSSNGIYQFGLIPPASSETAFADLFDVRGFNHALSTKELERIYQNGMQEQDRKGIPRYR